MVCVVRVATVDTSAEARQRAPAFFLLEPERIRRRQYIRGQRRAHSKVRIERYARRGGA